MVRLAEGSAETTRSMMTVSLQSVIGIFVKHLRSRRDRLGRPGLAGAMCGNCNVALRY
jgi:hypothetical protein